MGAFEMELEEMMSNWMGEYKYVVDESGNLGAGLGQSDGFVFGGYVIAKGDIQQARLVWRQTKTELCGSPEVELKWSHFFKTSSANPLRCQDSSARKENAILVAERVFHKIPLVPLLGVVRKSRVTSDSIFRSSKKGNVSIDISTLWFAPLALFCNFLVKRNATGEIYRDRLGSTNEENEWQTMFGNLLATIPNARANPVLRQGMSRINPTMTFVDSSTDELVQLADCICGLTFSASIGKEEFLAPVFQYFKHAERVGLGIVHLQ